VKRKMSNLNIKKEEDEEGEETELKKLKNESQIKAELLQVEIILMNFELNFICFLIKMFKETIARVLEIKG
jgi:hypothetical protein